MSKISIIGCGWLGLPLGVHFIHAGNSVSGTSTRLERLDELKAAGIKPYQLKAQDGGWHGSDMTGFFDCETLIIAIPPGIRRNPESKHAEEIKSLMDRIEKEGYPIKRILFVSSTSVYKNLNQIVHEKDILSESDAENKILYQAEQHVLESNIPIKIIVRLGGLTGYERMLGRFFAGKKEVTGGNEPVNLVHRDDVIGAISFIMKNTNDTSVFNICSPLHPTRRMFYEQLCARFNLEIPIFPAALNAEWKEVSSDKLTQFGYKWIFENPTDFTYTY